MSTQTTPPTSDEEFRERLPVNGALPIGDTEKHRRMTRLTVNLPADLVEQMRDAVYWTPGLTLAWMVARAMRTSLADLESANQGPFPKRSKPLRAGRPRLAGQCMKVEHPQTTNGKTAFVDSTLRTHIVPRSPSQ
jgi:hypothetical protein